MYIVIRNWERFQHYKDRTPKWIKIYPELHHDENFLSLTGHQRAVLLGLWLEYASARAHLPLTLGSLSARLRLRVMTRDLDALNHAGFIEYALAPRYQDASLDLEVEKRRETKAEEQDQTQDLKRVVESPSTYAVAREQKPGDDESQNNGKPEDRTFQGLPRTTAYPEMTRLSDLRL